MSSQRKVVRKHPARPRHGRDDHVCSAITPPAPTGTPFKPCGHNLAGAASTCGPPGDGKPLDLTQLSSEQRSKLESFLKSSGFGPLPKAGQPLDPATMRKLAQHMRAAAAIPSKTTTKTWGDNEKNPKDGLVRQAVTNSKRDDVKNLLEEGGDVDEAEPKTLCTPLMLAVRDGSKEIVQLLLDYDADVTRRDKDGKTAIMEACAAGRDDLVQLLIDHGSCVADTDNSNWNSLTHAAANGQIRCAQVVMRHLKYDKDTQDRLKEAVKKEDKKKKSKEKTKINDLDDYDDGDCTAESALAVAAQKGQHEFVKWYLTHKDQFKVIEPEIQTACSKACYSKRLDLVRMLIEEHGAKVNPEGPVAETPLCAAAACGDLDIVKYLLQRGARVNDSDGSGFTPLMRACNEGNSNLVPVFLHHGANVNAQNTQYENWTPLCFAILKGNMEIVQLLVAAHANVNLGGTPPLLLAVSFNNAEAVEYLLTHGASPTQKSLHGDTSLTFAADVGNFEWVKRFHSLGCDVDSVGDKGYTPLMKAAKKGSLEIVEYLLDNNASINRTSASNDCTALTLACSKGWIKIIEYLLEHGANRHIKLKDNVNSLFEAVKSGNSEAADLVMYHQPKNAEFRETTNLQLPNHRGPHGCDHQDPSIANYMKAAAAMSAPMNEFYMNYSCKHCDGHHGDPMLRNSDVSSEEDDEDDDDECDEDDDEEGHSGCEDDDDDIHEECESGEDEEDLGDEEDYTSGSEQSNDDEKKDSENYELPEILAADLADLDFPVTENYDIKEGLDADIDFIRNQLAHFTPQSFEFRILNAMLRKAEQLQVRPIPVVPSYNQILTNLLQKSLPNHTPEELRRRFSEEISRWQNELQSNSNVDDLMDKLVTEPSTGREEALAVEADEPTLADIASFLQANPGALDYPSVLLQRGDMFPPDSRQLSGSEGRTTKHGVSLSPDGKYIIMTNSNSNFTAPLGDFEFLRSIAAAADANSTTLAGSIEHLPEDLAKVMAEAKRNGVFNMEAFSTFLQGAKEDAQFLEDYRNATRVPATFDFSANTAAPLLAAAPRLMDKSRKYAVKKPVDEMPKLDNRRPIKHVAVCPVTKGPHEYTPCDQNLKVTPENKVVCECYNCGETIPLDTLLTNNDKLKIPRTPEPTPDDTSEENFPGTGSDDVPADVKSIAMYKQQLARSPKKAIRTTRDAATNVSSTATPAKKPALVDVDQQQESDSSTALIQAAIRGNSKIITMLCDAGAKPNHKDKKGWTALGYAVERGHKDAVKELCDHGADMDSVMDTNQAKRDSALTIACYNGRAEIVRILLDHKANIEHRNSNDYTPLCVACLNGHSRVAQMLIQRGADINARGTKLGIAPLMLAAMNGHTSIVKLLIESSADVNQCIETNRNTALTLACFQGRTECVRVLVEKGANLEWRSKNGLNAMMEAANGGFYEIGKILVEAGADVNCAPVPSTKDTPLTIAAEKGHGRFVQLLIDNGAAVNIRNKKGCSPLWLGCQNGHLDCVRALVNSGKADVDSRDNRQMSCILTAFKRGHENIVKILVDHIRCYPSEEEMTRYCKDIKLNGSNTYLLAIYERCKKAILDAKHKKEAEADAKARSLLEELDLQQKAKEGQRAKKRDKKKQKKKTGKNDDDDSSVTGTSNHRNNESEPNSKSSTPCNSRSNSVVRPVPSLTVGHDKVNGIPVLDEADEGDNDDPKSKKRKKKKTKKTKTASAPDPVVVGAMKSTLPEKVNAQPLPSPVVQAVISQLEKSAPVNSSKANVAVVPKDGTSAKVTASAQIKRPATAPAPVVTQPIPESDDDENEHASSADQGVDVSADEWVQQRSKSQKTTNQSAHGVHAENARRGAVTTPKQEGWKEVVGRSKRFKVPTTAIARIIGKGGTNINAIRSSTCAHIEIEKNKPGINDRLITVKGTGEAVAEAYHIIKTLCDFPDRDLDELLSETKRDSAALTHALRNDMVPSAVPTGPNVVHSSASKLSAAAHASANVDHERRHKPVSTHATTHSTQVFTNSQMHRLPVNTTTTVSSAPTTENYSSVLTSTQKRNSVHSVSSKESNHSHESSSPSAVRASSAAIEREVISPALSGANSAASTSNRGSPSSLPGGVVPTSTWMSTLGSPNLAERNSTYQQRPAADSTNQSAVPKPAAAAPNSAETTKAAPAPVKPQHEGNNNGIFGTLYKDLLSERSGWGADMDFFAKDLSLPSTVTTTSSSYQPLKESRILRSAFDAPSSTFADARPISNLSDLLTSSYQSFAPNRPSSLPHDARSTHLTNGEHSRYGAMNGFISPTYHPPSSMDSFGGYPGMNYSNGDFSSPVYHPTLVPGDNAEGENDPWNGMQNGYGYEEYPKEIDAENLLGVAERLAQFEMYGNHNQFNQNSQRRLFSGNGFMDQHDLGFGDAGLDLNPLGGSRLLKNTGNFGDSRSLFMRNPGMGSQTMGSAYWGANSGIYSMPAQDVNAGESSTMTSRSEVRTHGNGADSTSNLKSSAQYSRDRRNF